MGSRNMQILQNLMGGSQVKDRSIEDRTGADFERSMADVFAPDVEVHEPACMPHGGVHKGRERWFEVRRQMLEQRAASPWDQKLEVLHMWEVPDEDIIVMNYMMEWTDSRTGHSFRQPAVEVLTFRDGRIVKTEFYPQDSHALLVTLC